MRIAVVLWTRNGVVSGDGFIYHFNALDLVDGVGFYDPSSGAALAGHPPAWTVVPAGSSRARTAVLDVASARRLPDRYRDPRDDGPRGTSRLRTTVGLIVAAIAAVYPFPWLYEPEILSEPLAMLGTATAIWLAYRFHESPGLGPPWPSVPRSGSWP